APRAWRCPLEHVVAFPCSRRVAEGCRRHPSARVLRLQGHEHGDLGSNVNGSSLPNCSGTPDCTNFCVRTLCRWQASWAICDVPVPLGAAAAVARLPACGALAGAGTAEVADMVGAAVCADAGRPAAASAAATLADNISLRRMSVWCM